MSIKWGDKLQSVTSENLTGDRIRLPHSALETLTSLELPYPLTFRLSSNEAIMYASVREFTADEGVVELSPLITAVLGNGDLKVETVELLKGTKATLKALNSIQIMDPRTQLESLLRIHFTTLTAGTTISLKTQGGTALFLVDSVEPGEAILCLNTDIEVDIIPFESSLSISHVPKWTSSPPVFSISTTTTEAAFFKIPLLEDMHHYSLVKECKEGDADIFMSGIVEHPDAIDHSHYDVAETKGLINFSTEDFGPGTAYVYIGIHPFPSNSQSAVKFNLNITASNEKPPPETQITIEDDHNSAKVKCGHCQQFVPAASIIMHQAFCERNNIVCEKCNQVMKKDTYASHYHCPQCQFVILN